MGFKMSPLTQTELTLGSPATSIRQKQEYTYRLSDNTWLRSPHDDQKRRSPKINPARGMRYGITPNADELYLQQECQQAGVAVIQEPKSAKRIAHWFRAYRPYLLDDVMNNPALKSTHLSRFEITVCAVYSWNSHKTFAKWHWFRNLTRAIEGRLNRSKEVLDLLHTLRPDLLVLPNPFEWKNSLLLHAKQLGIRTVCEMLSWDNITCKGLLYLYQTISFLGGQL